MRGATIWAAFCSYDKQEGHPVAPAPARSQLSHPSASNRGNNRRCSWRIFPRTLLSSEIFLLAFHKKQKKRTLEVEKRLIKQLVEVLWCLAGTRDRMQWFNCILPYSNYAHANVPWLLYQWLYCMKTTASWVRKYKYFPDICIWKHQHTDILKIQLARLSTFKYIPRFHIHWQHTAVTGWNSLSQAMREVGTAGRSLEGVIRIWIKHALLNTVNCSKWIQSIFSVFSPCVCSLSLPTYTSLSSHHHIYTHTRAHIYTHRHIPEALYHASVSLKPFLVLCLWELGWGEGRLL